MKLNRIAIGGVAGIMGLGLIGIGAHAAFTTTTQSHQTVSAGTLSVILHATTAGVLTNTTPSITLPASANNYSSFTTGTIVMKVLNNGTLTANAITSTPAYTDAGSPADSALGSELYICVASFTALYAEHTGDVLYNGLLSSAPVQAVAAAIPTTTTNTRLVVNVYAGAETTACGAATSPGAHLTPGTSTAPSLTNTAEGGQVTVTETLQYQA